MTKLKEYIVKKGLKQTYVAGKISMTAANFNNLVQGKTAMPADILVELMKTLSCEAHEIYDKWPVKEQESVAA